MQQVQYYGIDKKQQTVEHGTVSENQAVLIVQDRFRDLKPFYESDNDALAATLFGFNRGKDSFIEISIHSRDHTDFKYEVSSRRKFLFLSFPSIKTWEQKITSPLMVERLVSAYYAGDHDELVAMLEG